MISLSSLLTNPTTEVVMEVWIANALLSALIQSLPAPPENPVRIGGIFYKSFYNFLSIIITDFKSFAQIYPKPTIPQAKQPFETPIFVRPQSSASMAETTVPPAPTKQNLD